MTNAGMAKLVKAHGLGPCGSNPLEVRVLLPAQKIYPGPCARVDFLRVGAEESN